MTELLDESARLVREHVLGRGDRPVFPSGEDLEILAELDEPLPRNGTDPAATLDLLHRVGQRATVDSTGGRYFGYVLGATLPVARAADQLVTAWDQSAASAETSPAAAALEARAGAWLLDVLNLPRGSAVGFATGASASTLAALATARQALLARQGWDLARDGLAGAPPVRLVVPATVHPTVRAAARVLGLGRRDVTEVPVDGQGRMLVAELPPLDAGTILVPQAGVLATGAFDDAGDLVPRAHAAGAWVHVDGAFGLWARACPRLAHLAAGFETADSWTLDTHKWLNTPYDGGVLICRDPATVTATLSTDSEFVPPDPNAQRNLTLEFSRRARGVPVWAALRTLGADGVANLVDRTCTLARWTADRLQENGFTVLNDVVLNQVLLRCATDEQTLATRAAALAEGATWFSPALWQGRPAFRISFSSWRTTADDADWLVGQLTRSAGR